METLFFFLLFSAYTHTVYSGMFIYIFTFIIIITNFIIITNYITNFIELVLQYI